jgi:hypothetical protein
MRRLTAVQRAALRAIVAEYDRAVAFERVRWGDKSADVVAARGICADSIALQSTVMALESRGLVQIRRHDVRGEKLRKGAFGKFLGGTKTWTETSFSAAPTDTGRALVGE